MMLGELLGRARRATTALEPGLRAEIERQGDEPPEVFARLAVADFERFAAEEDWTTLLSRVRRSDDPGAACLDEMVRWRLLRGPDGASRKAIIPIKAIRRD